MSVRKALLIEQSLTDLYIEANLRLKNGHYRNLSNTVWRLFGRNGVPISLFQFLKSLKLCKAP